MMYGWVFFVCVVSKEICFGSLRNSLSGLDILACPGTAVAVESSCVMSRKLQRRDTSYEHA